MRGEPTLDTFDLNRCGKIENSLQLFDAVTVEECADYPRDGCRVTQPLSAPSLDYDAHSLGASKLTFGKQFRACLHSRALCNTFFFSPPQVAPRSDTYRPSPSHQQRVDTQRQIVFMFLGRPSLSRGHSESIQFGFPAVV